MAYSLGVLHAHCEGCHNRRCAITPDELSSCSVMDCQHNCGHRFHQCKQNEHDLICSKVKSPCLNSIYGCPLWLQRGKLASHLSRCPASIVRCVYEWNRWPMHSAMESIRAPLPLDNPHVRCSQLDVALALRDQRALQAAMKTPKRIRKVFQNSITLKYPSVPLEASYDSTVVEHNVDNAHDSDDDTDAPWEASKYPPGLQRSVIRSIYKASKDTSDSLTYALDYVSSHIGRSGMLEKIKEIKEDGYGGKEDNSGMGESNEENGPNSTENGVSSEKLEDEEKCLSFECTESQICEEKTKDSSQTNQKLETNFSAATTDISNCTQVNQISDSVSEKSTTQSEIQSCENHVQILRDEQSKEQLDENGEQTNENKEQTEENNLQSLYEKKIKLHELLGVSLNIECISKYQPKPIKMFTFLCAQNFRRDEYGWHFKNVHNEIHWGLNGLLEQRCPLAEQGCDFTFQKLYPKLPKGQIVHSSLLESFGLVISNEEEKCQEEVDENMKSSVVDSCTMNDIGKRKLREATPEITTSCKYDSCIKIFPRYRRCSGCHSNQSLSNGESALFLTSLPFEVLQHIAIYLDSFSLCNLSLTSRTLRHVCCSLLDQKGMVTLMWEAERTGSGVRWKVAGRVGISKSPDYCCMVLLVKLLLFWCKKNSCAHS